VPAGFALEDALAGVDREKKSKNSVSRRERLQGGFPLEVGNISPRLFKQATMVGGNCVLARSRTAHKAIHYFEMCTQIPFGFDDAKTKPKMAGCMGCEAPHLKAVQLLQTAGFAIEGPLTRACLFAK
jgi:hypothetical protein